MIKENRSYPSILVVEDNHLQLKQLEALLTESGFFVYTALEFAGAKEKILHKKFDMLLLDLHLGEEDGMELLRLVKRIRPDFPVIILSSISYIEKKVSAFEIGVDDYVTKPYHPAELLLRIKRLLKSQSSSPPKLSQSVEIQDVTFDILNGIIKRGPNQFFLRKKILDLLLFLYNNSNQIMTKEQITSAVWKNEIVDHNVLSVSIHELRKYLEEEPKKPKILQTVKGLGYRLVL